MGRVYVTGLRAALRRWPAAVVLFAASLCAGICFSAVGWSWLSLALDRSLATRTLLTELDMNVFVDLFIHHGESLRTLLVSGLVVAGVFCLVGVWLNAVAVLAVGEPDAPLAECVRRGVHSYPTYLGLAGIAAVLHAASMIGALFLVRGLARWTAESTSEMTLSWVLACGAALGGVLVFFFATTHDHARVHSAATGAGAVRAYAWAMGYVGRREWRALALAFSLCASGGALWIVYQTVEMMIPTDSGLGVGLSLVWGEALLLARMLLRLWFFAAATELQDMSEQVAG